MLASSILLLSLVAAGPLDDAKWEVITSREGKFTVEMPVKPSRTRTSNSNGPNGKVTIHEISCETPVGSFLVKFKPSAKSLMLEIPGTLHDLVADIGKFNAPRILRPVDGDFLSIVRVDGTFTPGGTSTKEKTYPLNTGGLVLWKDSENYIFLLRTAMKVKDGQLSKMVMFEEREAGHRGATHNQVMPPGPVMIRLERKASRVVGGVSSDGVSWKALKPMDTSWASGPVKVGLLATNTSSEPSAVKFDNDTLKLAK